MPTRSFSCGVPEQEDGWRIAAVRGNFRRAKFKFTKGILLENTPTSDSKNMAMLVWVLTIFFGFIPPLIFFLIKKDDEYVLDHAKEALNWSITLIMAYMVSFLLILIVIGIFLVFALGIVNLVFCIMGAVAASSGKPFRVPLTLRLIK